MISFALTSSKLTLDLAAKLIKARVRLHNADVLEDDMAVIFVVNHFTRLETLLLPYILHKQTGRTIWSLASANLFQGRIGAFLRANGAVSTRDPNRDTTILHALLTGEHPWIIFPEGAMIKDKKVAGPGGAFEVYNDGVRRPPHRGAAALALVAEFWRRKLRCLHDHGQQDRLKTALERFGLDSLEPVLTKRTVIIPINITYYPIRAHENLFLRAARTLAKDLSPRAIDEISVEGTVLSEKTDIDIVAGNPIDISEYLDLPEYAAIMACGEHDVDVLEQDPHSLFHDAAHMLMMRYMREIYHLTTVNSDHLLAALLRAMPPGRFTERSLRRRLFLCVHELEEAGYDPLHNKLHQTAAQILFEASCPPFDDFIQLAIEQGVLIPDGGDAFIKLAPPSTSNTPDAFHNIRRKAMVDVIANEVEPLALAEDIVEHAARQKRFWLRFATRQALVEENLRIFEDDYAAYYDAKLSKGPQVGRPFLLKPLWPKGAIVLVHGYMAAPLEIRALGEYLLRKGYAVYGVRLKGHGTAPADLARTQWEQWVESISRGYALMRTISEKVILGGFSMGAGLSLLSAGRLGSRIRAAFAIDPPLQLRTHMVKLVPSIIRVNALLRRIRWERTEWEYAENVPENPHINYTRNPFYGVNQLNLAMEAARVEMPKITAPTLIVQGSKDPVVAPESAQEAFELTGAPHKQLLMLHRERHGIVNGPGAEEVFEAVHRFLDWALTKSPAESPTEPEPASTPENAPAST